LHEKVYEVQRECNNMGQVNLRAGEKNMENPNWDRATEIQIKFPLYFVGLVFTMLALAVQTTKIGTIPAVNVTELTSWCFLLASGVSGLLHIYYLGELHKYESNIYCLKEQVNKHTIEEAEWMMTISIKRRSLSHSIVIITNKICWIGFLAGTVSLLLARAMYALAIAKN
jgi:hypothetical protein